MKVLVCGGRDFANKELLWNCLDKICEEGGISEIIHGGAPGADSLAGEYASERGVPEIIFPADWKRFGSFAGRLRNSQMLQEGQPDLILEMPGGKGTFHMVSISRGAGKKVRSWDGFG